MIGLVSMSMKKSNFICIVVLSAALLLLNMTACSSEKAPSEEYAYT